MNPTPKTAAQWNKMLMSILTDIMADTKDLNIAAHHSTVGFILVVSDKNHRITLPHAAAELMILPKTE